MPNSGITYSSLSNDQRKVFDLLKSYNVKTEDATVFANGFEFPFQLAILSEFLKKNSDPLTAAFMGLQIKSNKQFKATIDLLSDCDGVDILRAVNVISSLHMSYHLNAFVALLCAGLKMDQAQEFSYEFKDKNQVNKLLQLLSESFSPLASVYMSLYLKSKIQSETFVALIEKDVDTESAKELALQFKELEQYQSLRALLYKKYDAVKSASGLVDLCMKGQAFCYGVLVSEGVSFANAKNYAMQFKSQYQGLAFYDLCFYFRNAEDRISGNALPVVKTIIEFETEKQAEFLYHIIKKENPLNVEASIGLIELVTAVKKLKTETQLKALYKTIEYGIEISESAVDELSKIDSDFQTEVLYYLFNEEVSGPLNELIGLALRIKEEYEFQDLKNLCKVDIKAIDDLNHMMKYTWYHQFNQSTTTSEKAVEEELHASLYEDAIWVFGENS